jgi:hypothetical protein
MKVSRRIQEKYSKGQFDATQGIYQPGQVWGIFLRAYKEGHSKGCKMGRTTKRLTDFKTK